jgi:hypothetical protein
MFIVEPLLSREAARRLELQEVHLAPLPGLVAR